MKTQRERERDCTVDKIKNKQRTCKYYYKLRNEILGTKPPGTELPLSVTTKRTSP